MRAALRRRVRADQLLGAVIALGKDYGREVERVGLLATLGLGRLVVFSGIRVFVYLCFLPLLLFY